MYTSITSKLIYTNIIKKRWKLKTTMVEFTPGNRNAPRSDELIFGGAIFTVNVMDPTTDGGFWVHLNHRRLFPRFYHHHVPLRRPAVRSRSYHFQRSCVLSLPRRRRAVQPGNARVVLYKTIEIPNKEQKRRSYTLKRTQNCQKNNWNFVIINPKVKIR